MSCNVFIRNLPLSYHEAELNVLAQSFGKIISSTVWRNTATGQSKGFGLVQFSSPEEANECILLLNNFKIDGHDKPLEVKLADRPRSKPQAKQAENGHNEPGFAHRPYDASQSSSARFYPLPAMMDLYDAAYSPFFPAKAAKQIHIPRVSPVIPEEGSNLFVRSLSSNVDELIMYKLFAQFGAIASVRVEMDLLQGVSKGYGFVKFMRAHDALAALEALNGFPVDGKALDITFHKPKTP